MFVSGMLTRDTWKGFPNEVYSDGALLWRDVETWDGLKFGLSGLDTLIVIREGRGETDLNQTVLFGIIWFPTS